MKTPLLLVFDTAKTAQYVELMCRRKGTTPERYIVENMEWDDKPDCLMVLPMRRGLRRYYLCLRRVKV